MPQKLGHVSLWHICQCNENWRISSMSSIVQQNMELKGVIRCGVIFVIECGLPHGLRLKCVTSVLRAPCTYHLATNDWLLSRFPITFYHVGSWAYQLGWFSLCRRRCRILDMSRRNFIISSVNIVGLCFVEARTKHLEENVCVLWISCAVSLHTNTTLYIYI